MLTRVLALTIGFVLLASPALAQANAGEVELPNVYPAPGSADQAMTPAQWEQLVAPIALYPDPLLTDILAASTTPAQVVEAQRFVADAANGSLQGAALTEAAASHGWQPAIQALLPFPQILALLDSRLEWTDRLGQAFAAQPGAVLDAVQRLRRRAQAAGTLASGPQVQVADEGGVITILPPSPQEMFLPSYDPACAYGDAAGCGSGAAIGWGDALFLPLGYGQWGRLNWRDRHIHVDHPGRDGHDRDRAGGPDRDIWHGAAARNNRLPQTAMPEAGFHYAPPAGERPHPARGMQAFGQPGLRPGMPIGGTALRVAPGPGHLAPISRSPAAAAAVPATGSARGGLGHR